MREKKLRGTVRKDRMLKPTALDRLRTAPQAPAHLSERARVEWKALARVCVELGVLTSADLRALELLAEILATESELREIMKTDGLTIPGAGGNINGANDDLARRYFDRRPWEHRE
jgi:phage terminase small subunit